MKFHTKIAAVLGSFFLFAALFGHLALAASTAGVTPGGPATGLQLTSPVAVCGSFNYNGGVQASGIPSCGGTFTCTSSGTITVANTYLTANSVILFGLKTANTPGALVQQTATVGTGFTVLCASGDTSIWNYVILG